MALVKKKINSKPKKKVSKIKKKNTKVKKVLKRKSLNKKQSNNKELKKKVSKIKKKNTKVKKVLKRKSLNKKQSQKLRSASSLHLRINSKVIGDVTYPSIVTIDGEFYGNLKCYNAILNETSIVSGSIQCEFITIAGKCDALIYANKFCEIKDKAIVMGDINYNDNITVEAGAKISGKLIAKVKPLALPDYTKKDQNLQKKKIAFNSEINTNDKQIKPQIKIKENSIDKIIEKIFK